MARVFFFFSYIMRQYLFRELRRRKQQRFTVSVLNLFICRIVLGSLVGVTNLYLIKFMSKSHHMKYILFRKHFQFIQNIGNKHPDFNSIQGKFQYIKY